jgi:uncharacterized membrane protein
VLAVLGRWFAPSHRLTWAAAAALVVVMSVWLAFTPGGLLGKADAVGYAVCHRIEVRSFLFPAGRQLPLCARCSGTFLGVLVGLFGPGLLLRRRRAAEFPPLAILSVLLAMSAAWAVDGANSYLHLIPREGLPRVYAPTNFLRLVTGTFHGITMGSLILPVVNATLWQDATAEPTLRTWRHLLALAGVGVALIMMVLSGWAVFLYPLAVLSAAGVITILAAICTVMVATVLRRENVSASFADALPLILLGLIVTFVLIGGIDALRYAFFQTWEGFDLSGLG